MMRRTYPLMDGWRFAAEGMPEETVCLPHTWNALDGQDGGDDYLRTVAVYTKTFAAPPYDPARQRVFLQFNGVSARAEAALNGRALGAHAGGYGAFRFEITDALGETNALTVRADNRPCDTVYPQKADFTFYGGIYRDVFLLVVDQYHFDLSYYGGTGIAVTATPRGDYRAADVRVRTWHNAPSGDVEIDILDADGGVVARGEGKDARMTIAPVRLWDGVKDPYLYTAVARLRVNGVVTDEVSARFGARDFRIDPKEGFFLNGRGYPLHGVCRHQDRKGVGSAVTRAMHDQDMALIREVGANTVRLAHYQHDPYFYDLCDAYGMIVWAEIPYISEHMPRARQNTLDQMTELIVQNYNHPSIIVWGLSNEITISTKDRRDMLDNHHALNDLAHTLDPSRKTAVACYALCAPFDSSAHISDIVSWNLYLGWYTPCLWLNGVWLAAFRLLHPKRCVGFSEYGAEGMPNLHARHPRRGDHTEEYQAKYHEYMLRFFARHRELWATHCWNMFDFAADARDQGGEPGMNHKGLVTFDRETKKDSFYLYKAWWSDEPFVHICGKRFARRTGGRARVRVYSNQPAVALYVNGERFAERTGARVFVFSIPLSGETRLEARAGACSDSAVIRRVARREPSYILHKSKKKSHNWAKGGTT